MALLSPGVEIREKDFSTIVPQVATAFGGIVGRFKQGPINKPVLISSVGRLVSTFGRPDETNYREWFTIAEYLKYSNKIWVVRAQPDNVKNAVAGSTGLLVRNIEHYEELTIADGTLADTAGEFIARDPGAKGNSLRVMMIDAGTWGAFKEWADNNAQEYPGDKSLASYFAQPPRTSYFVESRSESGNGARLQAVLANGVISSVNVLSGGRGYGSSYIEVGGKPNQFVNLSPVIQNGVASTAQISNPGSGYGVHTDEQVTILNHLGAPGSGTLLVTTSGGVITGVKVESGGSGYSTVPYEMTVTLGGVNTGSVLITAYDGVITSVNVINGGYGYGTVAPSLAVYDAGKDDELHILVIDEDGSVSGVRNTVLERWEGLSKASNARDTRNAPNYYKQVLNTRSRYIYYANTLANDIETANGTSLFAWGSSVEDVYAGGKRFINMTPTESLGANYFYSVSLNDGTDGTVAGDNSIKVAYDLLANTELYDVNLLMTAAFSTDVTKHVIESVAYTRKDCVAFVSPHDVSGNPYLTMDDVLNFRRVELNIADKYAQYAVMDTGFKYIFDGFNGKHRWVPLNGDIAGLCARVDETDDPWWSPGGYSRGGIKNVIKLAYNPNNAERDVLYPKGINPVISIPGSGTMLFGDRTMTTKPSAFDRINVRRLFNILEKSIGIAAKYQLFEFNDSFTRSQFRNMVEPFLRDIQGRRGITDFIVVCDETNNTGEVIDRNEFVADIYIKPARSINYIYLNFIATKTGVDFSTVIGG